MKISKTPTPYVLILAQTNSEWDDCHFALVHISKNWKQTQLKRLEKAKAFQEDNSFASLNFWESPLGFYIGEEEIPKEAPQLNLQGWAFVELEFGEPDCFEVSESLLDCHSLVIYSSGHARYKAHGKYTAEEFFTESFNLESLVKTLKS